MLEVGKLCMTYYPGLLDFCIHIAENIDNFEDGSTDPAGVTVYSRDK